MSMPMPIMSLINRLLVYMMSENGKMVSLVNGQFLNIQRDALNIFSCLAHSPKSKNIQFNMKREKQEIFISERLKTAFHAVITDYFGLVE